MSGHVRRFVLPCLRAHVHAVVSSCYFQPDVCIKQYSSAPNHILPLVYFNAVHLSCGALISTGACCPKLCTAVLP